MAGAAAQGDSGLQPMTGYRSAQRSVYMPAVPVCLACACAGPAERAGARLSIGHHEAPVSPARPASVTVLATRAHAPDSCQLRDRRAGSVKTLIVDTLDAN
jgi:hypothetical protein